MVNICVPVLKRYDLLRKLVNSLRSSELKVDRVYVVNNGRDSARLDIALEECPVPVTINLPPHPLGLAESWNWFLREVPEDRLITNDDVEFAPHSIGAMVDRPEVFVSCTFGFSCFIIRDECVAKVGYFDEEISPGYAYFEDRDYINRMHESAIVDYVVKDSGVRHAHSQTPAAFTDAEWAAHHRRFVIAQENFLRKWGKLPEDLERQFVVGVNG